MLLTSGYVSQLALNHCEHLSDCKKDSTREFVLIVALEELMYEISDVTLQNLS